MELEVIHSAILLNSSFASRLIQMNQAINANVKIKEKLNEFAPCQGTLSQWIGLVFENGLEKAEGLPSAYITRSKKYWPIMAIVDDKVRYETNPGFISSLKSSIGEDPKYIEAIARLQKSNAKPELNMKVLPVNFAKEHKELLQNLKMMLSDGLLAIDRRFEKLAKRGQCH